VTPMPTSSPLRLSMQRSPARVLGLAAGAGFIMGGGLRSRAGFALGTIVGRALAGTLAVNAIEAVLNQDGRKYRTPARRARRGPRGSATHGR